MIAKSFSSTQALVSFCLQEALATIRLLDVLCEMSVHGDLLGYLQAYPGLLDRVVGELGDHALLFLTEKPLTPNAIKVQTQNRNFQGICIFLRSFRMCFFLRGILVFW